MCVTLPNGMTCDLHRDGLDQLCLRRDLLRRVEHDPLRRGGELRRARMHGMAERAALLDDRVHGGELHGCRRGGRRRRSQPDRDPREPECGGERDPPQRPTRMPVVEVVAHERADRHEQHEHDPAVRVPVREREVAGEHREQHREREVVVVHGPALAALVHRRVGLASGLLRVDELAVRRDDDEEDVGDHDRPEHRADLEVRRLRGEQPRRAVRRRDDASEHEQGEQRARCGSCGRGRRRSPSRSRARRREMSTACHVESFATVGSMRYVCAFR